MKCIYCRKPGPKKMCDDPRCKARISRLSDISEAI